MVKKMLKKLKPKKKREALPTRITNDTVAQHREKVLAGGRKLKYPVQYTRRKLVRNAILISIAALIALLVLAWAQLYVWKDTGDVAYRITRIVPLPVATIDGEYVRYSNYLLYHRSTVAALEKQGLAQGSGGDDRVAFQQQQAMDRALEDAYAAKLAREHNITITEDEVTKIITQRREESGLSESAYESVVRDNLNWTVGELREAMRNTLLRQAVAFRVDDKAALTADKVARLLSEGKSLADIATTLGQAVQFRPDVTVPVDNADGGLSKAVAALEIDKTSGKLKTLDGDGYYFVTRHVSAEGTLRYSSLHIPLTTFKKQFNERKDSDAVKLFIQLKQEDK